MPLTVSARSYCHKLAQPSIQLPDVDTLALAAKLESVEIRPQSLTGPEKFLPVFWLKFSLEKGILTWQGCMVDQ